MSNDTYNTAASLKEARDVCDLLEGLLDSRGPSSLCDSLATVCAEKAEHVRASYQNEALAKSWDSLADKFSDIKSNH